MDDETGQLAHLDEHGHATLPVGRRVRQVLRLAVALIAAVTVVGLVAWWPDDGASLSTGIDGQGERVDATVTGAGLPCGGDDGDDGAAPPSSCEEVGIELTSGPNAGTESSFEVYPEAEPSTPTFETGDRIVVVEFVLGDSGALAHTFADHQRSRPLVILALLFVAAVVALGRFQGFRALGGLVVSAMVLFAYVFPSILDGRPPLGVALVAASVIAFAALYLAHGVNDTTTVALLGTMAALALTGILGAIFTTAARITGVASEDQVYLLISAEGIDLRGLVLAGIVLGSLGVLDDVTVTQVSAVARLREANPASTSAELYRSGVRIGRDHIASTVNTLVLAYAGAALPLLLLYANVGIGVSEAITSEIVAVEIIRTLVGSIGLVAAVPVTTLLAALVVEGDQAPADHPPGGPAPQPAATRSSWRDFTPRRNDF